MRYLYTISLLKVYFFTKQIRFSWTVLLGSRGVSRHVRFLLQGGKESVDYEKDWDLLSSCPLPHSLLHSFQNSSKTTFISLSSMIYENCTEAGRAAEALIILCKFSSAALPLKLIFCQKREQFICLWIFSFSLLEFNIPGPIFYEFLILHERYQSTITFFFANCAIPAMKQIKNSRLLFVLPTDLMELKLTVFRANCLGALHIDSMLCRFTKCLRNQYNMWQTLYRRLNWIIFPL
jgi:hypothetical protein